MSLSRNDTGLFRFASSCRSIAEGLHDCLSHHPRRSGCQYNDSTSALKTLACNLQATSIAATSFELRWSSCKILTKLLS